MSIVSSALTILPPGAKGDTQGIWQETAQVALMDLRGIARTYGLRAHPALDRLEKRTELWTEFGREVFAGTEEARLAFAGEVEAVWEELTAVATAHPWWRARRRRWDASLVATARASTAMLVELQARLTPLSLRVMLHCMTTAHELGVPYRDHYVGSRTDWSHRHQRWDGRMASLVALCDAYVITGGAEKAQAYSEGVRELLEDMDFWESVLRPRGSVTAFGFLEEEREARERVLSDLDRLETLFLLEESGV